MGSMTLALAPCSKSYRRSHTRFHTMGEYELPFVSGTDDVSRMLPPVKLCWKRALSMWVLTMMDMKKRREICRELVQMID